MEKPTIRPEMASDETGDSLGSDDHLLEACPPSLAATDPGDVIQGADGSWSARPLICNQRGLHARAAAKFVKLTAQFDAAVTVSKGGQCVSGQSIMGLMMLAAAPGCRIQVHAVGSEAEAAIRAICTLVAERFHEE